jgi:hypothetical protein
MEALSPQRGGVVMRFVEVNGFAVRLDKQVEFQKWAIANQDRIARSYPEGSEFGGIYAAVFSSEKASGDFYWLDIHDSYGALDRVAALGKDPDSEMARWSAEFLAFVDPDHTAGWSKTLLKSIVDATVMNLPEG